ncbi:unnamed protein product [Microthlaspi erraticum]|uniref:Uncharacterized protein n=1 Tax=Microthlaspi erraticum TaxID=1685480 RepID=A0A6D2L4N3_9BRAS|nr:unnamed protein product [Microthlaspi erraticum]
MASPSDLADDSCRDPVTESETLSGNPSLIEKPSVEQGNVTVEDDNSVANKALNLESAQEETQNQEDPEESDAIDQQPEASIEESRNEEDDMDARQAVTSLVSRRGGGPKRNKLKQKRRKGQEKAKAKLEIHLKTLKPIPFVPGKTLDFSRHEKLLKTLGIWEFLHLEFDQNIRQDLVAKLIAFYVPESRCSYVNESRINVSRADLARALKLPKKKDLNLSITDEEREILDRDESAKFIEEILSTWVLLQSDDMWIMPVEVVEWGKDIKQKQLEKLDWAGLIWFMVEKELKAEPPLGDCFFASHLQLLIKTQKEDLLRKKPEEEEDDDDDVKEVDLLVKSPKEECLEVEEENVGAADSRDDDGATESKEEKYVAEHMIELNLGQEIGSEMVLVEEQDPEGAMDAEENKKEEEERLPWNEDTHAGSHFLRRCHLSSASAREGDEDNTIEGSMEMGEDEPIEDVGEEETEEDDEKYEGGFPFFPNGNSLHGVSEENLMLEAPPLGGYNSGLQIHGNSSGGDFLASRVDMHMGMGSGSSSLFGNGNNKREMDHENDISYHIHNPANKRLRTEEPSWEEKPPPFEMCMDHIQSWVEKARLSCTERDQERAQSAMNQQYLMRELQNKEEVIQDLERSKFEEQQRKDVMIYRLESELRMMASVLEGYRKALKETKKASREHRKRCPLRDDKAVYMDVKGSGGLVLCTTEVEKLRLKQEAEDKMTRALVEKQIGEFESEWLQGFQEHMEELELLNDRLTEAENEVKIARETLSERKNHETSEVAAATEEI